MEAAPIQMKITLDPADPESFTFEPHRAVKQSGLTHQQIVDRLEENYGEKITPSGLSHTIWRGTVRMTKALRILDVCGVSEISFKSSD